MLWIGDPRLPMPRRGMALLGIFAILLQVALFGWHHHQLPLSSRSAAIVLAAGPPAGPPTPGLTDDDCQICFALSHHSAAPVDFVTPLVSAPVPPRLGVVEAVSAPLPSYTLFYSRAPPRA